MSIPSDGSYFIEPINVDEDYSNRYMFLINQEKKKERVVDCQENIIDDARDNVDYHHSSLSPTKIRIIDIQQTSNQFIRKRKFQILLGLFLTFSLLQFVVFTQKLKNCIDSHTELTESFPKEEQLKQQIIQLEDQMKNLNESNYALLDIVFLLSKEKDLVHSNFSKIIQDVQINLEKVNAKASCGGFVPWVQWIFRKGCHMKQ